MNSFDQKDPKDIDLEATQILSKLRSDKAHKELRINKKKRQNKIVHLDADESDRNYLLYDDEIQSNFGFFIPENVDDVTVLDPFLSDFESGVPCAKKVWNGNEEKKSKKSNVEVRMPVIEGGAGSDQICEVQEVGESEIEQIQQSEGESEIVEEQKPYESSYHDGLTPSERYQKQIENSEKTKTNPFMNISMVPKEKLFQSSEALIDHQWVSTIKNPENMEKFNLEKPIEQEVIYKKYANVKNKYTMRFDDQDRKDIKEGVIDEIAHLMCQYGLGRYKGGFGLQKQKPKKKQSILPVNKYAQQYNPPGKSLGGESQGLLSPPVSAASSKSCIFRRRLLASLNKKSGIDENDPTIKNRKTFIWGKKPDTDDTYTPSYDYNVKALHKSDGAIFESNELDLVFKFLLEVQVQNIPVEKASYPKRLTSKAEISKWKKEYSCKSSMFKIVHINDPQSFYNKFGLFGAQFLQENQIQNRQQIPPEFPVYELWHFRRQGKQHWRQVPHKIFYKQIFEIIHGRFHEGRQPCQVKLDTRYWFPYSKVYFEDYMIKCQVCQLKRQKVKKYVRRTKPVIMYEEKPLDRIQCDIIPISDALKEDGCKYNYILNIIDHHSKKGWSKLCKNKNPDELAVIIDKFFSKMFKIKGQYPLLLHTDMGKDFRNETLQQTCAFKGIRLLHGAPYHSQSQGLIERYNRTIIEQLTIFRQQKTLSNRNDYNIKSAMHECVKYYNSKQHLSIKCTPEESFQQRFLGMTFEIEGMTAEQIRARCVESTKKRGITVFQGGVQQFKVGDKVNVRDRIKVKIKPDGVKQIVPEIKVCHNYCLKAVIIRSSGHHHDLKFEENVPYLAILQGEIIQSVPQVLFRRQILFRNLNEDSLRDRNQAVGNDINQGANKIGFLQRNELYSNQKNYIPQASNEILTKQTISSYLIKDENQSSPQILQVPEEDEFINSKAAQSIQTFNAKDISDHKMLQNSPFEKPVASIINPRNAANFRENWVPKAAKKAKADDQIIVQTQNVGDLFDEMIGIDDAYEQSRVFSQ